MTQLRYEAPYYALHLELGSWCCAGRRCAHVLGSLHTRWLDSSRLRGRKEARKAQGGIIKGIQTMY